MDAATLDRLLTDSLLIDASVGIDRAAAQLGAMHRSWAHAGADKASLEWLGGLIGDLNWWSGCLLGGLSCIDFEQEVPDGDVAPSVC